MECSPSHLLPPRAPPKVQDWLLLPFALPSKAQGLSWTPGERKHQHCAHPPKCPGLSLAAARGGSCPPSQNFRGTSTPSLIAKHVTGVEEHSFQHSTGLCQMKPQPSGFIPFFHYFEFYSYPREQCCFIHAGFWVYSHVIFSMFPGSSAKAK